MGLHQVSLCLVMFLGFSAGISQGFVTLSPGLSQVCIGQDLVLTCATNQTAKVWNFVPPLSNHLGVPIPQDWFISFSDQSQQSQTLIVNSTKFTIERTSGMNSFPLVSTMTVVNSSSALNMATVSCTNIINSRHGMSALATIIVVGDTHTGSLSPLEVSTRPVFEMEMVSVTLEWMPEGGVSYKVSADHMVDLRYFQRTSVNLTVPYNTPTNVNITATSCGQNSETAITSLQLAYGRCEDPQLSITDDSVMAVGYRNLSVNGTVVTFSCPRGQTLTGPNSVMCTHSGQWEPPPSAVNCSEDTNNSITCDLPFQDRVSLNDNDSITIDGYMDPALEGAVLSFDCPPQYVLVGPTTTTCMGNGEWEPDPREVKCNDIEMTEAESRSINLLGAVLPSTVPACLVTSLLTFIGGFVCGRYFARRRYKRSSSSNQPAAPLYEDVNVLPSDVENQERPLEMRENVAYGPTMAARSCTTSRV